MVHFSKTPDFAKFRHDFGSDLALLRAGFETGVDPGES